MINRLGFWICMLQGLAFAAPDISTVKPDLVLPVLSDSKPAAGLRVKQTLPEWRDSGVYHVLYLPPKWMAAEKLPVIIEFAGNGPYKNRFGDVSSVAKLHAGTPCWCCVTSHCNTGMVP